MFTVTRQTNLLCIAATIKYNNNNTTTTTTTNNNNNNNNNKKKIQEFVYRDTTNVEPEMYDCTSNNWSHWNSNEKFKEKFGNCASDVSVQRTVMTHYFSCLTY